jgi:hypothetical protein
MKGWRLEAFDAGAVQIDRFSGQNTEVRTCRDGICSLPDTLTRLYTLLT